MLDDNKALNAILWYLPIKDFEKGLFPQLVMIEKNTPLFFNHKAEGISVIKENQLMVVFDDDIFLIERQPYQASYAVVTINHL